MSVSDLNFAFCRRVRKLPLRVYQYNEGADGRKRLKARAPPFVSGIPFRSGMGVVCLDGLT